MRFWAIFMRRVIVSCFLLIVSWFGPLASAQPDLLKMGDISRVMERLFHFHIEKKDFSPSLIRRSFKLYIEQFDLEKAYLLESEIAPYLNMQDAEAESVLSRVKKRNYSDFVGLNAVLEKAVLRAQAIRETIVEEMLLHPEEGIQITNSLSSRYSTSTADLMARQKNRMSRFYLFHQARTSIDTNEKKRSVFALFEKKIRRFENNYLFLDREGNALSRETIEHLLSLRILKSFAKSLDTHTVFFSPEEAYDMRMSLERQFEGVGVILSEGIDGVMIAELIEGGPAEQSGQIRINDLLVEIDGRSLSSESFEEVLDLLKKKDQSEIILGFKRRDPVFKKEMFFRVALRKRPIVMKNDRIQASYEECEGGIIGKIALHSFYESSDGASSERDIKEAIRSFREKGNLKGLVLDLRENSGGFLGQAVRVAGLFISNGVIVISKYGNGDVHYLRSIATKGYFNGPLVVLTSKMSASASEIVAQALQDYGVALIVGDERTFGKGSIQYQTITDPNADLFFKVTVGRYYTVSGRSTQIEGVIADIVVPTQYAPYNIGERYLEYPLTPDRIEPAYIDPLTDLDAKTRLLFEKRYLPNVQRVVSFWKKSLPILKQNSQERIAKDPYFQTFLKKVEQIRYRQSPLTVNTVDEAIESSSGDLQMKEAVNIVRDMIQIQTSELDTAHLQPTGSD